MIGEILTDNNIDLLTKTNRKINEIILHCSATKEGKDYSVFDIDRWHKARNFKSCGYHFVIYRNGQIVCGRPIKEIGAHTTGHNANSIGICYIGGVDKNGKPKDTRTIEQKNSLLNLVKYLSEKYPNAKVATHNMFARKACPSFSIDEFKQEYDEFVKIIKTPVKCNLK